MNDNAPRTFMLSPVCGSWLGCLSGTEWKVFRQSFDSLGHSEPGEVVFLFAVIFGVVVGHPITHRVHLKPYLLRRSGSSDIHFAWRDQTGNEFDFRVIKME